MYQIPRDIESVSDIRVNSMRSPAANLLWPWDKLYTRLAADNI